MTVHLCHGKAIYVRGPFAELPPAGFGIDVNGPGSHTWLDVEGLGTVDLSPNLAGQEGTPWLPAPFEGIVGGRWTPDESGRFVQYESLADYENQIAAATHREFALAAVYLPLERQLFEGRMISQSYRFVDSPLTDHLRKHFDESIYAKAILHFLGWPDDTRRSIKGVSKRKAWRLIDAYQGDAIADVLKRAGLTSDVPQIAGLLS